MSSLHSILKQYWGFDEFRPLQQDIIESVTAGRDTLALLPTGGGKSLCYQVPALAQDGICLVISPLIALMKDQVEHLKKKNILAAAIYSGQSRRQIVQTLKNVAYGPYKLLYVSPERLETDLFQEYLPAMHVNLIAVDEAHCISQWGYDFRPSYLRIAALREHLPGVPVLALTASATAEVQADICTKLQFPQTTVFRQSFERKNISYSAFQVEAKINKLVEILSKVRGTAIVYCKSRKRTIEIAGLLQMHGFSAHAYHAGLSQEERAARQEDWMHNRVSVMACTNAFGMGIDKPDVRVVVHVDSPDCLENYYQEAGRAGRDGKKAYAVLLYNDRDKKELTQAHEKRYPSFTRIKQVYNALVNHLQIPSYSGQDVSYNFRFDAFTKNFSLDSFTALYALKALEQDGWLDFDEKSFTPSSVIFTSGKQELYSFYKAYPQYESILTTLLRTYEGIFDFPAFVSEQNLAKLLRLKEEEVRRLLRELTGFHVIQYLPQNDAPQIIFRKHRVPAEELTMNHQQYNLRREKFVQRVQQMLVFIDTDDCRSQFINRYFGDADSVACGTCDNCLQKKNSTLTTEEFDRIHGRINDSLSAASLTVNQLLEQLNDVRREKAWRVLRFLQAENKIVLDEKGGVRLT